MCGCSALDRRSLRLGERVEGLRLVPGCLVLPLGASLARGRRKGRFRRLARSLPRQRAPPLADHPVCHPRPGVIPDHQAVILVGVASFPSPEQFAVLHAKAAPVQKLHLQAHDDTPERRVRARVHQRALQIRRVEGPLEKLRPEHAEKVENNRELPVLTERGDFGGDDLGPPREGSSGSSLAARASRRAAIFSTGTSSSSSSLSKSSTGSFFSFLASSFLASSFLASSFLASSFSASSFLASSFLASSQSSSFLSFFEGDSGSSPSRRPSPRGGRAGRVPRGSRRRRRRRCPGRRPLRRRRYRYPRLWSPSSSVSRPG